MLVLKRVHASTAVAPEPTSKSVKRWQTAGSLVTAATMMSKGNQTNVSQANTVTTAKDSLRLTCWQFEKWGRSEAAKAQAVEFLKTALLLGVYLVMGVAAYTSMESDWTAIDAAYFSTMTMSTVGYGDISPTSTGSRVFTILMIFFGVIFVFSAVANAIGSLTGPMTAYGRKLLERAFPQQGVDIDGDGGIDFYKPRPPPIYYAKNLMPSLLLTMLLQCLSAYIYTRIDDTMSYGDAIYLCMVTATTVGYGDVPNNTQAGRAWACIHMLLSVCLLGELISTSDSLAVQRAATLKRIDQLTRPLDAPLLEKLLNHAKMMRPMVIRDGKGLTELEFVLAMCVELEVVQWAQVRPFIERFRSLDVNGDARLGVEDLKLIEGKSLAEIKAMVAAIPQVPMSVNARMGLTFRRDGSRDSGAEQSNAACTAPADIASLATLAARNKTAAPTVADHAGAGGAVPTTIEVFPPPASAEPGEPQAITAAQLERMSVPELKALVLQAEKILKASGEV